MADLKNANTGYPAAIDTATAYVDNVDRYTAGVVNRILSAVLAIEGELGIAPSGSQSTLLDRLAVCLGTNGGLNSGTSFPLSPVDGQLYRRTDYTPPKIYQYQSSGASWALISSDAATLGGLSASTTPTPSTIPVSDGSNKLGIGWLPTSATGTQNTMVPYTTNASGRLDKSWMALDTMLVYDSGSLAAAVTTHDITGLDLNAQGPYELEFCIFQAGASSCDFAMYIDSGGVLDTTATNYGVSQLYNYSGSGAGASAANNANIAGSSWSGTFTIIGTMSLSPTLFCRAGLHQMDESNAYYQSYRGWRHVAAITTNVTQIRIVSSVASYIGIGSRFRVWRRR